MALEPLERLVEGISDASADAQLFVIEPGHAALPFQPDHISPCRCIVVP